MSEPNIDAAAGRSWDAEILADVSTLLQDCACLHYALAELIGDAQKKAAAARSNAQFRRLSAQLRTHIAKLGVPSSIQERERAEPTHRAPALQALARADHANALRYIALCDAETLRLIGQQCSMAGLSAETRSMLLAVHRAVRQLLFGRSTASPSLR